MADVHGSPAQPGLQMPQMDNSGPGTLPYPGGRDQAAGNPPVYEAAPLQMAPADGYVFHGVTGLNTVQDPSAHTLDGNPGPSPLATPYYPGQQAPVYVHGDADPGGGSNIAASVGESVAMATGRWQDLQSDTFKGGPVVGTVVQNEPHLSAYPQQQGSVVGDLVQFPAIGEDPGAGVGNTMPTLGFYDPPRGYGGTQGAPGYNTGNEPAPGYQADAE
jgi:hypothetical protein